MKFATLTTTFLFGLAVMTGGCASTRSVVSIYLHPSPDAEVNQNQAAQNGNAGEATLGWNLLYIALTVAGQSLADR